MSVPHGVPDDSEDLAPGDARGGGTGDGPAGGPAGGGPRRRSPVLLALVLAGCLLAGSLVLGTLLLGDGEKRTRRSDGRGTPEALHPGRSGGAAQIEPVLLGTPRTDGTGAVESRIHDVRFADADHGFALTGICEAESGECGYGLRATSDGGESWRFHRLPIPSRSAGTGSAVAMSVLGPRSVVIEEEDRRWFSSDGGRTWREPGGDAAGPPDSYSTIPEGGVLRSSCVPGDCAPPQVVAIDPRTGAAAPLRHQPDLDRHWEVVSRDGGAEWWVVGAVAPRRPAVAVTLDRGRSWRTYRLETEPGPVVGVSVAEGAAPKEGPRAYAFVSLLPGGDDPRARLGTVYSTGNGGTTWSAVERADAGNDPAGVTGGLLLRDGRLLVGTATGTMISADDGRTFVPVPELPALVSFTSGEGRHVARAPGGFYTSTDGLRWAAVRFAG